MKAVRQRNKPQKQAAAEETSESIAQQVDAFLKAGKKIEVLPSSFVNVPVSTKAR